MAASTFTKARPHAVAFPPQSVAYDSDESAWADAAAARMRTEWAIQCAEHRARRDQAAFETVEVEDRRKLAQRVVLFFERLVRAYRKGQSDGV